MKDKRFLTALVFLIILHFSASLSANGLGVHFNGGMGESRLNRYYYSLYPYYARDYNFKGIHYILGGGFVFDSSVAGDSRFNYRLQLSIDEFNYPMAPSYVWMPYNYVPKVTYGDAIRLGLKNTFGFAFFRNRLFRAWAGPSVSSYYYPDNLSSNDYRRILPRLFVPGIVIGLNYHVYKTMSLIVECGLNYEWSTPKNNENYMNSLNGYLSVGVIFRIIKNKKTNIRLQDQDPREPGIEKGTYKDPGKRLPDDTNRLY